MGLVSSVLNNRQRGFSEKLEEETWDQNRNEKKTL